MGSSNFGKNGDLVGDFGIWRENRREIKVLRVMILQLSQSLTKYELGGICMKSEFEYYDSLKKAYPVWMSKEQFRKVAHISKATASYLLESGAVPCKKSAAKTRCYRIKTEDVVAYLQDRIIYPEKYRATDGWYAKGEKTKGVIRPNGDSMILVLSEEQTTRLYAYFEKELAGYEDLMNAEEISEFLGYNRNSVSYWCRKKGLKCFYVDRRYLIPKSCLIAFLVSQKALGIRRKSYRHILYLADFMMQEKTE